MKSSSTTNKAKQTAKATSVVTSKAVAKQDKQEVTKSKKVTYLSEGVTGKMFTYAKIETNNEVKKENSSISFCIKRVLELDKGFTSSIKGFNAKDINPKNLIPLLKGKEAKSGKFSAWLVMQLISRYYKK